MLNASIKAEEMYDELRAQGNFQEQAARISNAAAATGRSAVGRKGGRAGSYDAWTVLELRTRAKELGITGYSGLNKSDLISELRER
ncbi:MAG: hypothetical protein QOE04_2897 [Mycobacterium sp.]|jgi:hypothetical protein|nr:hypothetical protein [Mycobacterium sp.]MDT5389256.1 hypothetical protein [Mycobacterium sp.]